MLINSRNRFAGARVILTALAVLFLPLININYKMRLTEINSVGVFRIKLRKLHNTIIED